MGLGFLLGAAGGARGAQSNGAAFPPGMAYKTGFPKFLPSGTSTTYGPPVWADLGLTPGRKQLVFGTTDKQLWVMNDDGTVAAGWPVMLPARPSTPTVADIDGDGIPEIVVGFGGRAGDPGTVGGVVAFERNGVQKWIVNSANAPGSSFPLGVVSTPAVGDVDGDGLVEVVWGSFDGHIYVVEGATGKNKSGWPLFMRDTIWSSPALYDLDNSGRLEIIIGTDSHADPTVSPIGVPPLPPTIDGGRLHVLRWDATEFPGFPYDTDQVIFSAPVVGDIDGDGRPEIVFGTGTYYGNPAPCGSGIPPLRRRTVYALHCDGTPVAGFGGPGMTHGEVFGSPALADLDGDGHPEVIVSDMDCSTGVATWGNFNVYAFKGTKGNANNVPLWTVKPIDFFGFNQSAGQPVVADIFGDTNPEILVATNSEIAIISSTGVQLTSHFGYSLFAPASMSDPAVDVDNGVVSVAAIGLNAPTTQAAVYVYTTTGKSVAPNWGQVRRSASHTGAIPGSGACAAVIPPLAGALMYFPIAPCRVVDTRKPIGPEGGPAFSANQTRAFFIAGLCGVPATAKGISLNVTVADATTKSWLTIFPGAGTVPLTNSISFDQGVSRANNMTLGLLNGVLSVKDRQTTGTVNVILDVNGYYR